MNTEIKEMKWILNTHKNIIDSNYNKEIIIDKLTIVDTDFDIINIRIKELTLYTTSDTNFSELNNLLKYIKFDYLKLYLYKIQSHDLDFLKVRIDEIFLINLALTPKIINLMHKNYFSLFKLHLIECENIKLINSKLLNLTELSLLANTFILPEVAASVRAHRPGIRGAPASYDISSLLREKTKIKKLQVSIYSMENLSVDKLLNFVINGNLIEFRLGLRFKIDNSILINFVKKLTKQTNLKKLYIFSEYDLDIKNLVKKLHKSNLEFFYINDENLLDCVTEISTKKNNTLTEISLNVLNKNYIIFDKHNFYILERLTSKNCKIQKIDFLVEQSDMYQIYNILKKTKIKEITIYLKSITRSSVKNLIMFFDLNLNKITLDDFYYFEYPKKRKFIENLMDFKNYSVEELYTHLLEMNY